MLPGSYRAPQLPSVTDSVPFVTAAPCVIVELMATVPSMSLPDSSSAISSVLASARRRRWLPPSGVRSPSLIVDASPSRWQGCSPPPVLPLIVALRQLQVDVAIGCHAGVVRSQQLTVPPGSSRSRAARCLRHRRAGDRDGRRAGAVTARAAGCRRSPSACPRSRHNAPRHRAVHVRASAVQPIASPLFFS